MEHKLHWRVGQSGAGKAQLGAVEVRTDKATRWGKTARRGGVAAIAASIAISGLSLAGAPAGAVVSGGRSIEVNLNDNLVLLNGYPPNTEVLVEVVRQGFTIGEATKTTDAGGTIEMNHVGPEANDCFDAPSTPDIVSSDTIRTTISGGPVDTSVMRGVEILSIAFDTPNTSSVTVTGQLILAGPARVVPGTDILELRINKGSPWDATPGRVDNRQDIIGADVNPDGSFSHVMSGSVADVNEAEAGNETFLEWSNATASELTVAGFGAPGALGCPPMQQFPTRPKLASAMDSARVGDHITNNSANLSFAGLVGEPGPGSEAQLLVDGVQRHAVTANGQGVYSFTSVSLAPRARPYSVKVRSRNIPGAFFVSAVRSVTIDRAAPTVVQRRLAPNPLHLAGRENLRAVYRISEGSRLQAMVQHVSPRNTVRSFRNRSVARAGLVEYGWNGKSKVGRDVRPGRYQFVLTSTDRAGNTTVKRSAFRVVR